MADPNLTPLQLIEIDDEIPTTGISGSWLAIRNATGIDVRELPQVEFPPSHGRLGTEEFSAGVAVFATGDCTDCDSLTFSNSLGER